MTTFSNAITRLSAIENEITTFAFDLDWSVRTVLDPLGFGFKPEEWTREVRKVFVAMNKEYRYDARHDIMQNARRISRRGTKHLLERIVKGKEMVNRATELLAEVQGLRRTYWVQLCGDDKSYILDHIVKFERALELITGGVDTAITRFTDWKDYFLALDKPLSEIQSTLLYALYQSAPQRDNAKAAKASLARLAQLDDQRLELSAKATSIATKTYYEFQQHGISLPQATVDARLDDLLAIQRDLLAQQPLVSDGLRMFETYSTLASSTPRTVFSSSLAADLAIDRLRQCEAAYKEILAQIKDVQEVYEPLEAAMRQVATILRSKAPDLVIWI